MTDGSNRGVGSGAISPDAVQSTEVGIEASRPSKVQLQSAGESSSRPSTAPSAAESSRPSTVPSAAETSRSSKVPIAGDSSRPSTVPSAGEASQPSKMPDEGESSAEVSSQPSNVPSVGESSLPSKAPLSAVSGQFAEEPSAAESSHSAKVSMTFQSTQSATVPVSGVKKPCRPRAEQKLGVEVTLRYGPYEACGVVDHRLHRLQGMQHVLGKAGHKIRLEPIADWNIVTLIVHGEQVFNCDIRDLDFGGDGLLDGLCLEALQQVNSAF